MIVKIQLSLYPSPPSCLIYDEGRVFVREYRVVPPGIELVMRRRAKAFFEATVIHDSVEVGTEVPDPGW